MGACAGLGGLVDEMRLCLPRDFCSSGHRESDPNVKPLMSLRVGL